MKIFKTKDFAEVPNYLDYFRVGPWLGVCVIRTKYFIVMKEWRK